jgi:uncharacterized sulfatase
MQLNKSISGFSIEDSSIIKGIGILLIAFHNFFHWIAPSAKENEFSFSADGIHNLFNGIGQQPLESINLIFSFWGHFGVQLFIFISGYGLMRAYQNKKFSWGQFVSKRINKLWPTFFFAMIVFYSLYRLFYFHFTINNDVIISYFLKISFLSNFFPKETFSLNGPWWFYSMIVQLYMVFPLLLWLHRKFGNVSLVIISGFAYLLSYIYNPWFVENGSSLYFFFSANIPVFSLGIALGAKEKIQYNHLIGLGALILFGLGNYFLSFWYISHLMFTISSLVAIYYLFLRNKKHGYFYKTILFYGELSMYLFAIHGFLRYPFIKIAEEYNSPLITFASSIGFMIVATISALILKWVVLNYLKILKFVSNKAQQIKSKTVLFLINSTKNLMSIGLPFIILLVLMRVYEYKLFHYHHSYEAINLNFLFEVIIRDILIGIGFLGILLLPYWFVFRISRKLANTLVIIFMNLIIIASIGLIQYYDLTMIPLDRVVYAYSWESMLELSNTTEINALTIVPFILSLFIFNLLIVFKRRFTFKRLFVIFFILLSFTLGATHNFIIAKEKDFNSEQEYFYSYNKLLFFVKDIIRYNPKKGLNLSEIGSSIQGYRQTFSDRSYLSLNYPFLRKADEGDPLGPYFYKTKNGKRPNIVFIIVESLCTPISGPYAYKGSFTPFLDSLTEHSLYWRNNLSTSERTFGVLPAVLGSLPYGKQGFVDMGLDMPEHKSIINILAKNDYTSRFFYGGWPHFNNMDIYMNINNIDTIINDFDSADSIPMNENGFSWGYSDRAIFQSTFKSIPDSTKSYLSIYLTLSTHSPFMMKNADYYEQQVIERMKELNISEKEWPGFIKNQQKLATFLFFDDELRKFFKQYKQREDYKNTIFVITGDHRGIIFYRSSAIDVYHTPLIIYSPLLKQAKEFGGVVSHADLTPTFLNYLENNYQIKNPKTVSWQGALLDTSTDFHCTQRMAFMRNNRDIIDYLSGNYYLSRGNLYEVLDTLKLRKVDDPNIKNRLKNELHIYKNLNQFSFMGLQKQAHSNLIMLDSNFFNFENAIPKYFENDVSSERAYSGKQSAKLRKDQEFGGMNPTIVLDKGISRLLVEISFKVFVSEFGTQNPSIILSSSKEGESKSWDSIDFMNNNFGTEKKWKTIKVSKTVFLNPKDSKDTEFKIYLWNRKGCELYYDDISVTIKAKK